MAPHIRLIAALIYLLACLIDSKAISAGADPDKDAALSKTLDEARVFIDHKKPQAAIEKCDKVIAAFDAHYRKSKVKVYCARTSPENLGYLLMAAADMDKGKLEHGKERAIVLSPTWATAYYMKGWALEELNRMEEARAAIEQAIGLSPFNSHHLSELAYLYMLEKNWDKALEVYRSAEEHASLSPDDVKQSELGRARRGVGYVLAELGKLDEAEKKYQQCLADDPNDTKAAAELEYVRNLKAKTKS